MKVFFVAAAVALLSAEFAQAEPLTPSEESRLKGTPYVSAWRKGEGCIEGFKRLGFDVSLKDCIKMAHDADIPVYVFLPPPGSRKPSTFYVPVKEGEPFGVIVDGNKRTYLLYVPPLKKSKP
jgi:hypothetical protein